MNEELETRVMRERLPRFADREAAEFIKKGNALRTVAAYRAARMVALPEAKAAVDMIRAGLGFGF